MFDPQSLWIHPRTWPNAQRGYLFLVPAAERVGEKLFGDAWKSDGFLLEEYSLPRDMLTAKPEARAYAHRILQLLHGDAYTPDYENRGWVPLGRLAALGANIADQATPQRMIQLGEPPERDEGYWFTDEQWEEVHAYLHATNLSIRPRIEMAREVARWLSDEIAEGSIRTRLCRLDEKDFRDGLADDWQYFNLDRRRRRLRNCKMMPGDPSSETGHHLIFIHAEDLLAALGEADDSHAKIPDEPVAAVSGEEQVDEGGHGTAFQPISFDFDALENEYRERVQTWPPDTAPPSRKSDELLFQGRVKRELVREWRRKHAPPHWQQSGRRNLAK